MPVIALASGVFAFLGGAFAQNVRPVTKQSNSQTMALLQSSASPFNATSSPQLAIVGGTSLSTENPDVSAAVTETTSNHTNDQISLYVVHEGDTLPGIAKLFGVTVNTIVWANDIKGNKVRPGDELVILPINGVEYTVKSGDTLQSIAKKYKGDIGEIAQFNDISVDERLAIGQSIIIPDGEMSTSPATAGKKGSQGSVTGHGSVVKGVNNGVGTSPRASGSLNAPRNAPLVGERSPNYPVYAGYYERPVIGGIKTQGVHGHNGVDLSAPYGANILAAADGQVIIARQGGWNGGYGSYIVIKHPNGTQTLYGHLSDVDVSVGQQVSQGDVIGNMGSTGDSTGVHLHFEIRGMANPF